MEDRIVFTGLMPHAPVLVPGVGGARLGHVEATAQAMEMVARHAVSAKPDTVVLISPHSPRRPGAFGLWSGPRLRGSLDRFGSAHDKVDLPLDGAFAGRLEREAARRGLRLWRIADELLDHGAVVPLRYLIAAGWDGPTVILGLNYPGEGGLAELGHAIAATAQELQRRTAVIASGDMSHRLTRTAPAGYDPDARRFDAAFIDLLRHGSFDQLQQIEPELQERAAEDVVDSTAVAVAAAGYRNAGHEVLSYEGPFGVGYGVAILYEAATSNPAPAATAGPEDEFIAHFTQLPRVARSAVAAKLRGGPPPPPFRAQGCLAQPGAVFVTLTTAEGDLRGCRGVTAPVENDIVREICHSAVAAALHDSRFPAVTAMELPQLRFSVTVLGPVEAVSSPSELDPGVYGVIVSSNDGRKGVLLPAIAGIGSVEQQLAIARRKARIGPDEPVHLERFTAHSYAETPAATPAGPAELTIRRAADPRIATHPARWWVMRQDGRLECQLCPRYCKLQPGQRGFCFVRQRLGDELVLTTYGRSSGFYIDPIEKKPLNHFLPGTSVLSFGTAGCNLGCRFCQNWHISKARKFDRLANAASPEMIASAAQRLACRSVAFTYNDPVIFAEYALDVAHECHARNIKTVAVTAGYITETARAEFFRGMDAANVDLKGFSERFYQRLCYGRLQPVLDTLEYLHQATDVWLEVTTLLIPGQNDSDEELHQAAEWFAAHLGPDVPWHFTAFHPDFKMRNTPPTPTATLLRAREIARSKGLRYVYTGNVRQPEGGSTWCPSCAALLIERQGFELATYALDDNRCTACGHPIAGHFEHQPGHWGARCQPVRVSA